MSITEKQPASPESANYEYPRMEVLWHDAESADPWESNESVTMELPVIRTLGYLLAEDDAAVLVAGSIDTKNNSNFGRVLIPRGVIISMNEI
jgi:hypothetical protein